MEAPQADKPVSASRVPVVALLLGFLLPGAGQAYCGLFWRAVAMHTIWPAVLVPWLLAFNGQTTRRLWLICVSPALLVPWVVSVWDGYRTARRLNDRLDAYDPDGALRRLLVLLLLVFPVFATAVCTAALYAAVYLGRDLTGLMRVSNWIREWMGLPPV
jgi:hypothetical protein